MHNLGAGLCVFRSPSSLISRYILATMNQGNCFFVFVKCVLLIWFCDFDLPQSLAAMNQRSPFLCLFFLYFFCFDLILPLWHCRRRDALILTYIISGGRPRQFCGQLPRTIDAQCNLFSSGGERRPSRVPQLSV